MYEAKNNRLKEPELFLFPMLLCCFIILGVIITNVVKEKEIYSLISKSGLFGLFNLVYSIKGGVSFKNSGYRISNAASSMISYGNDIEIIQWIYIACLALLTIITLVALIKSRSYDSKTGFTTFCIFILSCLVFFYGSFMRPFIRMLCWIHCLLSIFYLFALSMDKHARHYAEKKIKKKGLAAFNEKLVKNLVITKLSILGGIALVAIIKMIIFKNTLYTPLIVLTMLQILVEVFCLFRNKIAYFNYSFIGIYSFCIIGSFIGGAKTPGELRIKLDEVYLASLIVYSIFYFSEEVLRGNIYIKDQLGEISITENELVIENS